MLKKILLFVLGFSMILSLSSCKKNEEKGPSLDLKEYEVVNDNNRNFYQIFVHSFYDTNSDKIGDLKGVIKKLDYIKDLGFTGIWLLPINKSNSSHKYDVIDYYQIDPSYGTLDDLKELINECHKRDIKLILDLVLNHSSNLNKLFIDSSRAYSKYISKKPLTEEELKYKDFYSFFEKREDVPNGTRVNKIGDFYYECNFTDNMPEFNCDNPLVREEFKKIMKFYLDLGVDGFRLDAVKYYYINRTSKNVEFLKFINDYCKSINPKSYIVGECWDNAGIIEQYYQSGIDSFFNFPLSVSEPSSNLINSINRNGELLNRYSNAMTNNYAFNEFGIPAPFLDNHDMPRYSRSDSTFNKFMYGLLQMLNGASFTYYGSEIGMTGNNKTSHDDSVRVPIKWGEENNYGDTKVLSNATDFDYLFGNVKEQEKDINSILNYYKKVLNIRNTNIEIARGVPSKIDLIKEENRYILILSKEYLGKRIYLVFNFSDKFSATLDIKNYDFNNLIDNAVVDFNEKVTLKDNVLNLPAYSIAILK